MKMNRTTSKKKQKLKIATTQFPVSADLRRNAKYIKKMIRQAGANKADIVQFCEAALSGYVIMDYPSFDRFDWHLLREMTVEVMGLAKECGIWVALGSTHYVSERVPPTNCIYIISDEGKVVDRYDKCFVCSHHYTPGSRLVTLTLKGHKLGFLICYDGCYPEIYNAYRHKGVEIMLHSFYNARHEGENVLDEMVPAKIRMRAADNTMWVIASNSSARHSCWATCIGRPDGSIADSLKRHVTGILYHEFPDDRLKGWIHNYKMMKLHKDELLHNGKASRHPRVVNRKAKP